MNKIGGFARASVIGGVLTNKGNFIDVEALQKHGLFVTQSGGKTRLELTAKGLREEDDVSQSRELLEAEDPFDYNTDRVISPPWPFDKLSNLITSNVVHGAAIETKAGDYAYGEWELVNTPWADNNIDEKILAEARDVVTAFLSTIVDGLPIEDICHDLAIDYEALGSAGFEVLRRRNGLIAGLNHIPFTTMRVARKELVEQGIQYIQKRYNRLVLFTPLNWFMRFTNRHNAEFDPTSSPSSEFPDFEDRENHIFVDEDRFVDVSRIGNSASWESAANEFVMLARPPFTRSQVYGTPAGISAYTSMLAQLQIDSYNLQFFENKGVPQYAVIVEGLTPPGTGQPGATEEGGTMSPTEEAAMANALREYFTKQLKSASRGVLMLTGYGDVEIRLERLSTDTLDASFAKYEQRNREMVRMSHRVPPAALGINETANLGSGRDSIAMKRYRDHIVRPGRRVFERIVDRIIRCGLLIGYFNFRMKPLDVDDAADKEKAALDGFSAGALSLDEYRIAIGMEPLLEGRGDFRLVDPSKVLDFSDTQAAKIRETSMKAIHATKCFIEKIKKETGAH